MYEWCGSESRKICENIWLALKLQRHLSDESMGFETSREKFIKMRNLTVRSLFMLQEFFLEEQEMWNEIETGYWA